GDREKCLAVGMDDYLAKPVRLDDMRSMLERWGEKVAAAGPVSPPSKGAPRKIEPVAELETADVPLPSGEDQPVEMDRLLDFTDSNPDSLRELVTLYLDQTSRQIEQMESAINAGQA